MNLFYYVTPLKCSLIAAFIANVAEICLFSIAAR